MKIKKLKCFNFRNILDTEIIADSGMNVICGENAQGKTNLIEAIWLFSGAKSFRNTKDSSFLNFEKQKARTEIEFISGGIENTAIMEFSDKRKAFLNEKLLNNPSKLAGNFNAIIFSPADLSLVKDGPQARRRFLDVAIGQLYPNYINILADYLRAVKQRNQVIKELRFDGSIEIMLDVFEEEIADKGIKLINYRKKYIEEISGFVSDIYNGLSSGKEKLLIKYLTSVNEENYKEKLKNSRKEDSFSGITSIGPHRDDIIFNLNGINARNYGSQGQQRSIAISLKLAQAQVIKNKSGEYPICLLDDVMSELDPSRQSYILNHIRDWQCFLSCCDPSNIANLKSGKVFEVKKGEVKENVSSFG
ncbi:MAG: DNA replication/repair protein RecF [Ruminococcaceae bacterium]|nr:DNA replication/repair protein RecF [Oscillospiraceae bacterium]